MDQVNHSPLSKNNETCGPQKPADPRPNLSEAELAEWEVAPKHIKETWEQQPDQQEGEQRVSAPRPPSPPPSAPKAPPTYKETGRAAGRSSGMCQPGYGNSKRLLPGFPGHRLLSGFSGPEFPAVPNLAEQEHERIDQRVREW